jgi:hypothetical protein
MKKDLLKCQKNVSLSEAEEAVLGLLAGVSGMSQSGYLRKLLVDNAVALKAMPHPMADEIAAHEAAQVKA